MDEIGGCYGRNECVADEMGNQQPLDNRTLSRLETAVSKSSYVGAGKKLKVKNTVRLLPGPCSGSPMLIPPRSTLISSVASLSRLATGQSTSASLPSLPR